MNQISSSEINNFKSLTNRLFSEKKFANVTTPEKANSNSLVFVSSQTSTQMALLNKATGYIVLEKIYDQVSNLFSSDHCVWTTKQINAAMAEVLPVFDSKLKQVGIHSTAVIHPTATLGLNTSIGAYTVIKENVTIGPYTIIGSHVVIESHCVIGAYCKIASHTTIGADGFGYYTDKNFIHHKIPQIGIVVIEDNCELGTHCSVDRATLTETRIKAGSKLDNFCHVAHNCEIGENAILAAGFMVAGSTKIGKNLMTGGGVHINGHVEITDNVIFAGNSGVVSSVEKPGIYGGFPQTTQLENLKIMSSIGHLPKLRRQVSKILKHLGWEE